MRAQNYQIGVVLVNDRRNHSSRSPGSSKPLNEVAPRLRVKLLSL
jgi:hypothetical protein